MSGWLDRLHGRSVHPRRVRVLGAHLEAVLPRDAKVLDVGCGDGLLAATIIERRPDLRVEGIDVLVRADARIPVTAFDGSVLPFPDRSFDEVMFVDVLHHTEDPNVLLREAARVSRRGIVLKDHLLEGWLAGPVLRFMDEVGNARHGVALPHNYWPRRRWTEAFTALRLRERSWREDVGLYPWPADLVFGRSLHFIARLEVAGRGS
jgi:SAM-dependent methyltransferase